MAKFCHVWKHTWNSIVYSNLRFGKKSGEILTFFCHGCFCSVAGQREKMDGKIRKERLDKQKGGVYNKAYKHIKIVGI